MRKRISYHSLPVTGGSWSILSQRELGVWGGTEMCFCFQTKHRSGFSLTWQVDTCSFVTCVVKAAAGVSVRSDPFITLSPHTCRLPFLSQIHALAGNRGSASPLSKHSFIVIKAHGFCSLGLCHFWDPFVSDQSLCSLCRQERSLLLVGVRQWPTSDTYHLQNPQPCVEQSFYIVSALFSLWNIQGQL